MKQTKWQTTRPPVYIVCNHFIKKSCHDKKKKQQRKVSKGFFELYETNRQTNEKKDCSKNKNKRQTS